MKKKLVFRYLPALILVLFYFTTTCQAQFLKKLKDKVTQTASDHVTNDAGNATDKTIDKTESSATNGNPSSSSSSSSGNSASSAGGAAVSGPPSIKTYQNYDFVPGDSIVFYDDFTEDKDGEFPSHWNLEKGQGVVNKAGADPAFFLTEGNYVNVDPLMKTTPYLSSTFTVEFDYMVKDGGSSGIICFMNFKDKDGNDQTANVNYSEHGNVSTGYFPKDLSANYPGNGSDNDYYGKWHHAAIIIKNNQLKCYLDQYRVLVMPNVGITPYGIGFGGIGSQDNPIIFRNVRIANGGNMNMIGQKFTASKIVTHGITFDIDQSAIKPESMGTLNMVAGVIKANPDIKFEIDGHTDNTGDAAHNLTLSQQRADAVEAQLIKMGIDASRLTTKGFGDTKPIDNNDTPEGKANNRRVEFVRM